MNELEIIAKCPEMFPEVPVSVLAVMEKDKQAHRAQELFDQLIVKKAYRQAEKIARFMWSEFGLELSAD